MVKIEENIIFQLKNIIDINGPEYLTKHPYGAYLELSKTAGSDNKLNGAILCFLVSSLSGSVSSDSDFKVLSQSIQKECGLEKNVAEQVAYIFSELNCCENEAEWREREHEGLNEFLRDKFVYEWDGRAAWGDGNGVIACRYEAEIVLTATVKITEDDKLMELLYENPFLKKEAIYEYFAQKLEAYLDECFEYYCTCEPYYEPNPEDFHVESDIEEWCKKSGFEMVSCEGYGEASDYIA
jgi:hypothetical protein